MGLNLNSKIVTDGLVFAYDMGNKYKSFKGAPTTNLASFDIAASGFSTDTPSNVTQTANSSERMFEGRLSRKIVINAAGYWNAYIFNYNTGVSSTAFAASCKVKTLDGLHPNTFMSGGYIYGSAGNSYPGLTFTLEDNGWYRVTWLYSGTSMTLNSLTGLNGTAPSSKTFYITDYQVEALSFSTPFAGVSGASRSNNQSLLDLTNKTTITSTSLTYNSDNTFSFNGSSGYITIPWSSIFNFNSGQTIIIWMKNQSPSSARRNPYNQAYAGGGTITHENDTNFSYYWGTGGGDNSPYQGHGSSFSVVVGETAMICLTRDASNVTWYKNGEPYNSTTNPYGASVVTGTNNITIGNGYTNMFGGSIYAVQLYNRGLTAAEVKQNFNALRGRYGI